MNDEFPVRPADPRPAVARLADELRWLGQRLDEISGELRRPSGRSEGVAGAGGVPATSGVPYPRAVPTVPGSPAAGSGDQSPPPPSCSARPSWPRCSRRRGGAGSGCWSARPTVRSGWVGRSPWTPRWPRCSSSPHPYAEPGLVHALLVGAGISAQVTALAVALLIAGGRVGWVRPEARSAWLWVPIGLVGLYGTTSVVVTLTLLVAPDRAGFTAGHAVVTVAWTVLALILLARGISRPALRVTGLVLVAAALAKLVLFDLVALDGIARVAAFLGAGLVLLATGTRYARLVAEAPKADR